MTFASLGLLDALLRTLDTLDYRTPTPVQAKAIPAVLKGRDLMAAAQTGTGKTGGFALPVLTKLFPEGAPRPTGPSRPSTAPASRSTPAGRSRISSAARTIPRTPCTRASSGG